MFKISTSTRYGIRALTELAKDESEKPVNLADIARNQNISLKYLENIFKLLKNNNIVRSTRGPGGGYQLIKPPAELDIYTLIVAIDGPLATIDCTNDPLSCEKTISCQTRIFWKGLQEHIITFLKSRTLKDITEQKVDNNGDWYATI